MFPRPFRTLCATFVLVMALPASSWAQQAQLRADSMAVRTGEHKDFDRIVFDAPKGTTYKIQRSGAQITLTFSRAAHLVFSPFDLGRAKDLAVISGLEGNEPLAVRFAVDPSAQVRDFYSGPSVVLDITGPLVFTGAKADKKTGSKPVLTMAPPVEPEKKAEAKKPEPQPAKEVPVKEAPAKETKPAPAKPEPVPEPEKKAEPAPEPVPPQPADAAPTPQAAPVPVVHEGGELDRLNRPSPFMTAPPLDSKTAAKIRIITNETTPKPVAVFDPKTPAGVAVFTRAGYVTVVFDKRISADVFMDLAQARVKVDPFPLPKQTGFRIAVPEGVEGRVGHDGTAWEIYLVKSGSASGVSTDFVAQPDFALGARLLLPVQNPPEPFFFTDPSVGDTLLVIPMRDSGAFTLPRKLADFQIVPAAQGLVIKPYHEKVTARAVPDGVEITSEGGLKLSPSQDSGVRKGGEALNLKRTFDFARWRGRSTDSYVETRQKLLQTVIEVPDDQKVLARMDMVRFLFAHGMGTEAEALLKTIPKQLPEIENQPDFIALRGALAILAGHEEDGLKDLQNERLADQPEITLWKSYALAQLRDWTNAAEGFKLTLPYLDAYPEPLRSRMMIMAIESALAVDKKQDAAAWLSAFESGPHASWSGPAITYLRGVLYAQTGRAEKAAMQWRLVAKDTDRLYKIRAELALIDYGVATKSMTSRQAADRLEGLRFAWRGDDLEFDILRRLGGFYIDARDYRKGLATMSQALRLFPTSAQSQILRAQMTKLFRDLYVTKLGDGISPLEALSLYSDFRFLIPEGESGNEVRRSLAERLVAIDLLDPAGTLLDDVIKNSTSAAERAKTATRLAGIRLLDQKADAAIAVLDQSQPDAAALSAEAQIERSLLRARALSEKGKYEEALALLPPETNQAGNMLRADMAMRAKRWGDAAKALLNLVGPPVAGKSLTEEQAGWLVNAATAYAQAGDLAGLDRLAGEYDKPMQGSSKADLFHILTRPEKATQMKDITAAQAKLSEVDMFRSVLNAYRTGAEKDKK